jgi:hypothetical protein
VAVPVEIKTVIAFFFWLFLARVHLSSLRPSNPDCLVP